MEENKYSHAIIATASISNKSENQDAVGEFASGEYNSIYVADGLGSFKYSKRAAQEVTGFFLETDNKNETRPSFDTLFGLVKEKVVDLYKTELLNSGTAEKNLFGTTAIKLCEFTDSISVAYVGNGGIWHIRGNFTEFPMSYHLPWCAVNYLNPHTLSQEGKEALYKLISDSPDPEEASPSVIDIRKDLACGDIMVICSDGIYSADQVRTGKNEKGVWIKSNPLLQKLYEYLAHFFKTNDVYDKPGLEQILSHYMEEIKPLLDDDASVGILVTKDALNFQAGLNKKYAS